MMLFIRQALTVLAVVVGGLIAFAIFITACIWLAVGIAEILLWMRGLGLLP